MALSKAKNFKNFISFWFCDLTARYMLDLVFCFSYTDYKFICYLLLFAICLFVGAIFLLTRNTSTSCEISSNLVKTALAFLIFLFTWSQFHFAFLCVLLNWQMLIVLPVPPIYHSHEAGRRMSGKNLQLKGIVKLQVAWLQIYWKRTSLHVLLRTFTNIIYILYTLLTFRSIYFQGISLWS